MPVDVVTTIEIARPRGRVAEYTMDPANAPVWYKNIGSVALTTPGPLAIGSEIAFEARFLGRSLAYTYAVTEFEPGRLLVMRTADGPFPMETTYAFEDTASGATTVTLRNRGEPAGFSRFVGPLTVPAMRHANRQDLKKLEEILEATP
ncbi:SRPBCC family protein [Nocardia sp. NPDC101769]|uniref:SRPBCC family protein n=1 Tax=Nocardia sp. NPDC101769 TaxID=3364333 RepID=UPI0038086338